MRQFRISIFLSAAVASALMVSAAAAQDTRSGCTRDVTRHCRAVMDSGDMAVLACLKEHRPRLSKTCQKVLSDNGQ